MMTGVKPLLLIMAVLDTAIATKRMPASSAGMMRA